MALLPRLLLFWMTHRSRTDRQPRLELGPTLASFMRDLGLDPGRGGIRSDAYRLREQMDRLFRSTISFEQTSGGPENGPGMARHAGRPKENCGGTPSRRSNLPLWGSWVELGEAFHDAIIASPVPIDLRALRALKKSPLALDLYAWATYKTYAVNRSGKEGQPVSWRSLQQRSDATMSNPRHFKAAAKIAVRKVQVVFPGFRVEEYEDENGGGLLVKKGTTSVGRRKEASPLLRINNLLTRVTLKW